MAQCLQSSLDGCIVKTKRKSYSREFMLGVVGFMKNIIFTKRVRNILILNTKTILRWKKDKEKIHKSKKGSKHVVHRHQGHFPKMETPCALMWA